MSKKFLPFNLQFFAEESGATEPEIADPAATEDVHTDGDTVDSSKDEPGKEGVKEPDAAEPEQSQQLNAQFAAIRRRAEEDARLKYEAEKRKLNSMFSETFGKITNPATGKPIQSASEYIEAYKAQQRVQAENQLKQGGVDPSIIQQLIASDPAVREAHEVMERQKVAEQDARIASEIAEIGKINPAIKSIDDLAKDESFPAVMDRWNRSGMKESLYDIYRLVNFDTLTAKKSEAAKQAAINQAKGKSHMESTPNGVNQNDGMADIPEKDLAVWKEYYPNATMAELKQKYNATL